jgi:hypothetical protein
MLEGAPIVPPGILGVDPAFSTWRGRRGGPRRPELQIVFPDRVEDSKEGEETAIANHYLATVCECVFCDSLRRSIVTISVTYRGAIRGENGWAVNWRFRGIIHRVFILYHPFETLVTGWEYD